MMQSARQMNTWIADRCTKSTESFQNCCFTADRCSYVSVPSNHCYLKSVIASQAWSWELPGSCSWHCWIASWYGRVVLTLNWLQYHIWGFLYVSWLNTYICFWLKEGKKDEELKYIESVFSDLLTTYIKCLTQMLSYCFQNIFSVKAYCLGLFLPKLCNVFTPLKM